MSTINIDLAADTILNVMIGQQDENEVREVVFDFSGWYTTYGSGTISLAIQRPKDEWPYEGTLTVDSTNHKATWEISDTDTAYAGTGQIQLSYKVGDAKKKSVVYRFTCHKSLGALGSVVTPVQIQTFIDEVEEALQTMDGKLDDMEDEITDVKADLQNAGLSEEAKQALLACFNHVTWDDDDPTGQTYIDALEDALYPTVKLESISCVYTQSGVVYDTDSLESLKTDLVVTAYYSDSSTQVVTNYVLGGVLEVGTSTITVSYGGKTTTFTVTVTQLLPTGYTKLAYVATTGAQYVNTGVAETECSHAWYDVMITSIPKINGLHILSSTNMYFPFLRGYSEYQTEKTTNGFMVQYYGNETREWSESGTAQYLWDLNTRYVLEGYVNNNAYINGDLLCIISPGETQSASNNLCLFTYGGAPTNTTYRFYGRLYEAKMYDANDDLIRHFIPCKNSSNVAGLYDVINNVFYTSATNTALVAGEA